MTLKFLTFRVSCLEIDRVTQQGGEDRVCSRAEVDSLPGVVFEWWGRIELDDLRGRLTQMICEEVPDLTPDDFAIRLESGHIPEAGVV